MKKREEKEEEEVGSSPTGNLPQAAEYSGTSRVSITGVKDWRCVCPDSVSGRKM